MEEDVCKLQLNLDLTKCQGTVEIGSLYRVSFPYILKGRVGEYRSLFRGLRYTDRDSLNWGSTVL